MPADGGHPGEAGPGPAAILPTGFGWPGVGPWAWGGVLDPPHHRGKTSAQPAASVAFACCLRLRRIGRVRGPLFRQLGPSITVCYLLAFWASERGHGLHVRAHRGGWARGQGPHSSVGLQPLSGLPHVCRPLWRQLANDVGYQAPDICLCEGGGGFLCASGGGGAAWVGGASFRPPMAIHREATRHIAVNVVDRCRQWPPLECNRS